MIITVGFSKASSPWAIGSKIIQLGERTPFSHCYISYVHPVTQLPIITQASHGMLNQFSKELFLQHNCIVFEKNFSVTKEQYVAFLTYIQKNLGKKYGYSELVLIAIKKVLNVELNVHDGDNTFICSEFAGKACEALGLIKIKDQDYFTPKDLYNLIQS